MSENLKILKISYSKETKKNILSYTVGNLNNRVSTTFKAREKEFKMLHIKNKYLKLLYETSTTRFDYFLSLLNLFDIDLNENKHHLNLFTNVERIFKPYVERYVNTNFPKGFFKKSTPIVNFFITNNKIKPLFENQKETNDEFLMKAILLYTSKSFKKEPMIVKQYLKNETPYYDNISTYLSTLESKRKKGSRIKKREKQFLIEVNDTINKFINKTSITTKEAEMKAETRLSIDSFKGKSKEEIYKQNFKDKSIISKDGIVNSLSMFAAKTSEELAKTSEELTTTNKKFRNVILYLIKNNYSQEEIDAIKDGSL